MKKFNNLLKKEIKELVTAQLIISLVFTLLLFNFIGSITKSEIEKGIKLRDVYVLNLDDSSLSKEVLNNLSFAGFKVNLMNNLVEDKSKEKAIDYAKNNNINFLLVIPDGFGQSISKFSPMEIEVYSIIRSFSIGSTVNSEMVNQVVNALNRYISNNFLKKRIPNIDPEELKNPIRSKEYVIVRDKMAEGSSAEVTNFVQMQSIFIPIILMIVIMYSSQMVLSAIAVEKQDKTLETLLTVPISRRQIVVAKMLGAGIVGLISALIYMFGYRSFMSGITGGVEINSTDLIQKLGLQFTPYGYTLLGVSLFLAILCALALSTILGVLAEDLKGAQSMSLPMVLLVMIPYFLSMFSDINSLSLPIKIIVMAIPFTHPFVASQNVLLGNYNVILYGIIYMLIVFLLLIFIAARIFSTDRVLTMKLSFGRRKASTKGKKVGL
ncbi:MAG TPA: ABC transporter permease [Dictyoglomaceae bacterium]|nr:ABC transporter permease [Dictyoglomaceae bacterium]